MAMMTDLEEGLKRLRKPRKKAVPPTVATNRLMSAYPRIVRAPSNPMLCTGVFVNTYNSHSTEIRRVRGHDQVWLSTLIPCCSSELEVRLRQEYPLVITGSSGDSKLIY